MNSFEDKQNGRDCLKRLEDRIRDIAESNIPDEAKDELDNLIIDFEDLLCAEDPEASDLLLLENALDEFESSIEAS